LEFFMKKVLMMFALALPLYVQAAATATAPAAPTATGAALGMMAQLPTFLTQLDTVRGKALTVAEKTAVTGVVSQANTSLNGIQGQFIGGVSKATGLDAATLGVLFPSATKPVSTSDLTGKVESKMGSKLNFLQKTALTSANTLRNNSLDSLKTNLSNGVAQKLGMDPALVTSLLPLLGF
jgi:hypothetical protein